jgi:malate/lactate dehydrogenase
LAAELEVAPREVFATVMGLPPGSLFVPQGTATAGGVLVERLSAVALRRATEAVTGRLPGPVALATAAVRVVEALTRQRPSALSVVAALDGEYEHRGIALAVPGLVASGGLRAVVQAALEPVDRVAFDNAARRRYAAFR